MTTVAATLACFLTASATPHAATWYRETLLGENGSSYALQVSEHLNEGTYYRSRELQRVERIDKRSGKKIESLPIREVDFVSDMQTWAPSIEERSMSAFDLAAHAAKHHLSAPFARDFMPMAELDSTGLVVRSDGRSEIIVPMATIRARFVRTAKPTNRNSSGSSSPPLDRIRVLASCSTPASCPSLPEAMSRVQKS